MYLGVPEPGRAHGGNHRVYHRAASGGPDASGGDDGSVLGGYDGRAEHLTQPRVSLQASHDRRVDVLGVDGAPRAQVHRGAGHHPGAQREGGDARVSVEARGGISADALGDPDRAAVGDVRRAGADDGGDGNPVPERERPGAHDRVASVRRGVQGDGSRHDTLRRSRAEDRDEPLADALAGRAFQALGCRGRGIHLRASGILELLDP